MNCEKTKLERCNIDFYPNFLSEEEANNLFEYLEKEVVWNTRGTFPGKASNTRRIDQNYGDDGVSYTVNFKNGSTTRVCKKWLEPLKKLRDKLSKVTNSPYNYCVVQRYPSGKIGISPHRDKEMNANTDIAGISLGATRELIMLPPHYNKQDTEQISYKLTPGSLYVLKPPTNSHWAHCIEKDEKVKDVRISLTFRYYVE